MARTCKQRDWSTEHVAISLCGTDVAPPASLWLLKEADQVQLDVGMAYCQTALMVENNTAASGTTRRFMAVIPPGRNHAYLTFTRCASGPLNAQVDTTAGWDATGLGTGTITETVKQGTTTSGAETYLGMGTTLGDSQSLSTSDHVDDVSAGLQYRALIVPEDRVATNAWFQVSHTAGHCLVVHGVTQDLETLP